VYLQYLAGMGVVKIVLLTLALVGSQVAWIVSEWWLAQWASASSEEQRRDVRMWLGVYGGIVACTTSFACFGFFLGYFLCCLVLFCFLG
jgi:hypothetical protein